METSMGQSAYDSLGTKKTHFNFPNVFLRNIVMVGSIFAAIDRR